MGIDGLTKTIKKIAPLSVDVLSYREIADLSVKKVYGVDVSSYLYPSLCNITQKGKGNHIREFLEMIATWATVDIHLLFVFDGNTHSEAKKDTLAIRSKQRSKNQQLLLDIIDDIGGETSLMHKDETLIDLGMVGQSILNSNSCTAEQRFDLEYALRQHVSMSPDKIHDLVTLFQSVGAMHIQAKGEADFILASLYRHGHIDGVLSEDTDMLTHGVGRLVRGTMTADMGRRGRLAVYTLSTLLSDAGLSMPVFIDLCILCGCDYCPKIRGVASAIGLTLLDKYKSIPGIIEGTKYRPDCPIEIYLERYSTAVSIFTTDQEKLPAISIQYLVADGLEEWLVSITNYTNATLSRKLEDIRKCLPPPSPRKIKVTLKQPN